MEILIVVVVVIASGPVCQCVSRVSSRSTDSDSLRAASSSCNQWESDCRDIITVCVCVCENVVKERGEIASPISAARRGRICAKITFTTITTTTFATAAGCEKRQGNERERESKSQRRVGC